MIWLFWKQGWQEEEGKKVEKGRVWVVCSFGK
jgi:hypothetical protein